MIVILSAGWLSVEVGWHGDGCLLPTCRHFEKRRLPITLDNGAEKSNYPLFANISE